MPNRRRERKIIIIQNPKVQMIYLPVIITTLYSLNNGVIKKAFYSTDQISIYCVPETNEPFLIIKHGQK